MDTFCSIICQDPHRDRRLFSEALFKLLYTLKSIILTKYLLNESLRTLNADLAKILPIRILLWKPKYAKEEGIWLLETHWNKVCWNLYTTLKIRMEWYLVIFFSYESTLRQNKNNKYLTAEQAGEKQGKRPTGQGIVSLQSYNSGNLAK